MSGDPFAVLGLAPDASLADVRDARRRLAKDLHPDVGGDGERMREVNRAFDQAVRSVRERERPATRPRPARRSRSDPPPRPGGWARWVEHDNPSFTIDVLPAEAFEALLVVASWNGEVLVDDPPYLLDVHLYEPAECWCRLELVPEAGATSVSLTVASPSAREAPAVEAVRDLWVGMLNDLGREGLET
ncbi:MAG TPA: hypothetical protein VF855_08310 [Acidimicrobiales bacterium]